MIIHGYSGGNRDYRYSHRATRLFPASRSSMLGLLRYRPAYKIHSYRVLLVGWRRATLVLRRGAALAVTD